MGKSLNFAKIVATPSDTAWSQAYNAGSLFVVVSLSKTEDIEPESLPTIGKEILNILQSEFFVLEDKSLPSLKAALAKSLEHTPSSLQVSLVMAFNKDDILYLLLVGGGKVLMKRGDQTGTLLEYTSEAPDRSVHAASGILKSGDVVIIQTEQFASAVSPAALKEALSLELPNDMAETLSPGLHSADHAASAALILSFQGITTPVLESEEESGNTTDDTDTTLNQENLTSEDVLPPIISHQSHVPRDEAIIDDSEIEDDEEDEHTKRRFRLPALSLPFSLPKRSLILLGVVILLVALLIGSIYQTKKNQTTAKSHQEFEQVFTEAQKKYDEAMELSTINKDVARDDFVAAQEILKKIDGKFRTGSTEEQQIAALQKKIVEQIGTGGSSTGVQVTEIAITEQPLFQTEVKLPKYTAFTMDEETLYAANATEIVTVSPTDQKTSSIVVNDSDWEKAQAIATYNGNVYILDKTKGIVKFTKAADYQPSSYFKDGIPDLQKAVSMSIDSSIYILRSDGKIQKYTKGAADTFNLTGLSVPLSSPTKIFTSADITNLYVLDPSSSRIVIFDKSGTHQKDISSPVVKDALDFAISTDEETAFVLSKGKAYSLPLK